MTFVWPTPKPDAFRHVDTNVGIETPRIESAARLLDLNVTIKPVIRAMRYLSLEISAPSPIESDASRFHYLTEFEFKNVRVKYWDGAYWIDSIKVWDGYNWAD